MYLIYFNSHKVTVFKNKFSKFVVQNLGSFYNYKDYKILSLNFRITSKFLSQGSHITITPKVKSYLQLWK
jgi:hypothetical protein